LYCSAITAAASVRPLEYGLIRKVALSFVANRVVQLLDAAFAGFIIVVLGVEHDNRASSSLTRRRH